MSTPINDPEKATFVETALKLGGKSDEEAKKTGALDRADEQVESLFAKKVAAPFIGLFGTTNFPSSCFCRRSRPFRRNATRS